MDIPSPSQFGQEAGIPPPPPPPGSAPPPAPAPAQQAQPGQQGVFRPIVPPGAWWLITGIAAATLVPVAVRWLFGSEKGSGSR